MTVRRVVARQVADDDAKEAIDYYLVEASQHVAIGFVDALEEAYRHLALHSETGSTRFAHELDIPGPRSWMLTGYPYVVFYLETTDEVDVWRVLRAERDIPRWLAEPGSH